MKQSKKNVKSHFLDFQKKTLKTLKKVLHTTQSVVVL